MTAASAPASVPTVVPLSRIHVVFKTHLDVGFTNRADTVLRLYRERFIPQAISIAARMRQDGGDRFIWTTGSFLIWHYLEHGSSSERRAMEEAIAHGDIVWHALPFTTHTELMDAGLVRTGLGLSRALDTRFGRSTIAAKMTDVTGHTRALVPLLAEAGVRLLHIGVNPASSFPKLPALSRWQDPATRTEVLLMYHTPYGDIANAGRAPEGSEGLVFAHTGDNQGPQDPGKLREEFAAIRSHFPAAQVAASTLDAFAASLLPGLERLPVITCEIGDNWIHGAGSDPLKVAGLRALLRLRSLWRASGLHERDQAPVERFERALLLVPEHTWGMDIKTHLHDERTWSNGDLARKRRTATYRRVESSWQEQRSYLTQAVAELGRGRLADQARQALSACRPHQIEHSLWQPLPEGTSLTTRHFTVEVDGSTGALRRLDQGGHSWADATHQLGAFRYQTFSIEDYRRFYRQYARDTHLHEWWIIRDITKYGLPDEASDSAWWKPLMVSSQQRETHQAHEVLVSLQMPRESTRRYGCPQQVRLLYRFPHASARLELTLDWMGKRATRLPEAMWLAMRPRLADATQWRLQKLGSLVEPLSVPSGASRHLHGVEGASYRGAEGSIRVEALDTPLVAPGRPRLTDFADELPDPGLGLHWNLQNNVWCTNFPMWYEDDGRSRFHLDFATA